MCVSGSICVYSGLYVCMQVCIFIFGLYVCIISLYVCIWVCMCVSGSICVYLGLYVCIIGLYP